jgi:hypothetical protein
LDHNVLEEVGDTDNKDDVNVDVQNDEDDDDEEEEDMVVEQDQEP